MIMKYSIVENQMVRRRLFHTCIPHKMFKKVIVLRNSDVKTFSILYLLTVFIYQLKLIQTFISGFRLPLPPAQKPLERCWKEACDQGVQHLKGVSDDR